MATFTGWSRCFLAMAAAAAVPSARADNFANVYFDSRTDELVVTMVYRGTNGNHAFTLQWGPCKSLPDGGSEVVGEVLDSQAQDAARHDFKKTVRLGLDGLECRPAKVTLRTAPRFYYSLKIPVRVEAPP